MPDFLRALTAGFMPHGYCMRWDGPLLLVFISANLGIAVAYFLIPLALRHFVGKRRDLPYPHMFKLFAAFIMSCGITHIVKVWTIFQPAYWIEAVIDAWTAGISLITAFLLFPLIPQALSLRSPKELEEANAKLKAEIAERRRAEELAEAARDEAIQANKLKSDFVANVSHEIRTPMSGVIGMAELLTHEEGLNDETREIAMRMFRSSKQLLTVLNELLDFSKLEAGRVEMETIAFSPRSVIEDVVSLIMSNAQDKGLNVIAG